MLHPLRAISEYRTYRREKNQRAAPIDFSPGRVGNFFGSGLAGPQPRSEILLRESVGVADIAARAIANRLSSLNPQVFTRTVERGKNIDEILDGHPLKLLLDKPHANYTRRQLLRVTAQYIVTIGEAYWLKIRNSFSAPVQLQPMPAQSVKPIVANGMIEQYAITRGDGQILRMDASEVIRFWFPDPETLYTAEGYLAPNAVNADAANFAGRHLRSKYQNDAIPPIMLQADSDAEAPDGEEWERWVLEWQQKYHRHSGTHKGLPAMLPPGWRAVEFAIASGADITPLLEYWQTNELMNYGVPSAVLGKIVSGDRSSAEVVDWIFDKRTILPIAELISDGITQQLAPDFDASLVCEFEKFVSEDKAHLLAVEKQDLELKVRSGQQVIEDRGQDPERAGWAALPVGTIADTPYTGEEMDLANPADDAAAFGEPDDDDEADPDNDAEPRSRGTAGPRADSITQYGRTSKAASRANQRAEYFSPDNEWQRVMRRERKFLRRYEREHRAIFELQRKQALANLKANGDPDRQREAIDPAVLFDPEAWDAVYEGKVFPVRRGAYVGSANEAWAGLGIGGEFRMTPTLLDKLKADGAREVRNIGATTQKAISRQLAIGAEAGDGIEKIARRINGVFSARRGQARTIARTELLKATQSAQIDSFTQSEVVPYKAWNDNQDSDVRDSHFGSLIDSVRLEDSFILAPPSSAAAMHPGDGTLAPGDLINCRCFVTPVFVDPAGIEKGDT